MTAIRVDPTKLDLSEAYRSGRGSRRYRPDTFWSYVDSSGGADACWPWVGPGGHDPAGYGQGQFGWTRKAHREAYRLTHPDFDRSLDVAHRCDNPPCCNVRHLFAATRSENILDASRKGRLNTARHERHPQAKLSMPKARAIRARAAAGESQRSLAAEFGVSQVAIHFVLTNQTWVETVVEEASA